MINVAVIGYGYSAKTFHMPLINTSESFELIAISSSQKDLLKRHTQNTQQALGGPRITNAMRRMPPLYHSSPPPRTWNGTGII